MHLPTNMKSYVNCDFNCRNDIEGLLKVNVKVTGGDVCWTYANVCLRYRYKYKYKEWLTYCYYTELSRGADKITKMIQQKGSAIPRHSYCRATASFLVASYKLGEWVTDWLSSNRDRERSRIWHKGSLGDEDDARTSNTCIAQRNHAIPHSVLKNRMSLTLGADQ